MLVSSLPSEPPGSYSLSLGIACLDKFGLRVMQTESLTKLKSYLSKPKKAKWLSGEPLQIAVKRREVKSKGEKERYKRLNAEFQRIVRRDKKVFLSNQCREIEESNRMGKTKDLFKKIRDSKETFHA